MSYIAEVETTIQGIPCLLGVFSFYQKSSDPDCWDSDCDFYGYTECEFDVLDRKGYPAKWLERKLDNDGWNRLEQIVIEQLGD